MVAVEALVKRMPKVEIHVHIEATASATTYLELNKRHGIDPSLRSIEDVNSLVQISSLENMIKNFISLQSFFEEVEDYVLMVKDMGKYAMDNNIRYCEAHFSPSLPRQRGLNVEEVVALMEQELDTLQAETGVDVRLIMDLSRTFGPKNAMENLETTMRLISKSKYGRIVAVGLGGSEKENDILSYSGVFELARANGISYVAHAGEAASSKNVCDAAFGLGASRIGHATSAQHDQELMRRLSSARTPIEVCVKSNIVTREYVNDYEDHPIRLFFLEGMNVSVNSDDPFLFSTSITSELLSLHERLGFSIPDMVTMLRNSINATFLPEQRKEELLDELRRFVVTAWLNG